MIHIPESLTVLGFGKSARWVEVPEFQISKTLVSNAQWREVMGFARNEGAPEGHPVTKVSWKGVQHYLNKSGLASPTRNQWQYAAQGPAVNMREKMMAEKGHFSAQEFPAFAQGRYHNYVLGRLGEIFNISDTAGDGLFLKMIQEQDFWGWPLHSTPTGALTHDAVWFEQGEAAPVTWGPDGPSGTRCMSGNVWEWIANRFTKDLEEDADPLQSVIPDASRVVVGGAWNKLGDTMFRGVALFVGLRPEHYANETGFRVVANPA
jgi:formylglycine-generating enzyme required for sulfatase activity